MWKLIISSLFVWNILSFDHENDILLIMDDCEKWNLQTNGLKYESDFIISKSLPENQSVSLGHMWFDPKPKPETKKISFSEINEMNRFFTSEMNYADWIELRYRKDAVKIYILRPEDFCSQNRFVFDYKFILYEVKIGTTDIE